MFKKTIELQKILSPTSNFHDKRSVADLQREVDEVRAIIESIESIPGSAKMSNRMKKCWDRGSRWIREKRGDTVKRRKAKPELIFDLEDLRYL